MILHTREGVAQARLFLLGVAPRLVLPMPLGISLVACAHGRARTLEGALAVIG